MYSFLNDDSNALDLEDAADRLKLEQTKRNEQTRTAAAASLFLTRSSQFQNEFSFISHSLSLPCLHPATSAQWQRRHTLWMWYYPIHRMEIFYLIYVVCDDYEFQPVDAMCVVLFSLAHNIYN